MAEARPVRDASADLRVVAQGIDHAECVAWFDNALFCGTETGKLLRIDPDNGKSEVIADTRGFLTGIAFDGDGYCYGCDVGRAQVLRISLAGQIDVLVEDIGLRRLSTPNYPAFTSDGTLWVTDSGTRWGADDGFLFRVGLTGEPEIVDDACHRFPNGLAWSTNEEVLYLCESRLPGVVTYSFRDGFFGSRTEWMRFERTVPDGLAVDQAGTLFVSCWRPDRVYRIRGHAEPEVYLDDWTGEWLNSPTNLCFAGQSLDRLCFASLGGWSITDIAADTPGRPLPLPRRPDVMSLV